MARNGWFGKKEKPGPKVDQAKEKAQQLAVRRDERLNALVESLYENGLEARDVAAVVLGTAYRVADAAAAAKVDERTIYRWKQEPDFMEQVDRITVTSGISQKAPRLRVAMKVIRKLEDLEDASALPVTKDGIQSWLKYAQSEEKGMRLFDDETLDQLATLAVLLAGNQSEKSATGGSGDSGAEDCGEASTERNQE